MVRSKRWYAEQVLIELQDDNRNIDFKIDERDVFVRMDSIVNALARQSFFDNWKMIGGSISDQFITTWDGDDAIEVVDQDNGKPSYMILPMNYADLPKERGIDEIWPLKYSDVNTSVIILSHSDVRSLSTSMAGNLGGRIGGYPQGNKFIFSHPDNGCGIKKKFGKMGLRLVGVDSSTIAEDQPYPIPADKVDRVIEMLVSWFRDRRNQPTDEIRDDLDKGE